MEKRPAKFKQVINSKIYCRSLEAELVFIKYDIIDNKFYRFFCKFNINYK